MNIIGIRSLKTNYTWIMLNHINDCIVVDPGDGIIILKILKKYRLTLQAILLTHEHNDHTDGVNILVYYFPKIRIYGPIETQNKGANIIVSEGDNFNILNKKIIVFDFSGHTKYHIGFYCQPYLFCGDTVFSAGCGKIVPNLAENMYKSLLKIRNFPNDTLIYGGHEYTLSNINFAISILPENKIFINYRNTIIELLKKNKSTIPTTLNTELQTNLFFMCDQIDIKKSTKLPLKNLEEWKIFSELRRKKDLFNNTYLNKKLPIKNFFSKK